MLSQEKLEEVARPHLGANECVVAGWLASPRFPGDALPRIGMLFGALGAVAGTLASERGVQRYYAIITNRRVILEDVRWTGNGAGTFMDWTDSEIKDLWFEDAQGGRRPRLLFAIEDEQISLELAGAKYDDFEIIAGEIAEAWTAAQSHEARSRMAS